MILIASDVKGLIGCRDFRRRLVAFHVYQV
jgi:hypothetical protein